MWTTQQFSVKIEWYIHHDIYTSLFLKIFIIYLFLTALGLRCCLWLSLFALSVATASLVAEHGTQ